jgi:hypothetical protein
MVVNLADPSVEPSDEELVALSQRAFADVRLKRRLALERLHTEIAELRRRALQRVAELQAPPEAK